MSEGSCAHLGVGGRAQAGEAGQVTARIRTTRKNSNPRNAGTQAAATAGQNARNGTLSDSGVVLFMSEVAGESGFQVAAAYVSVSPDASDFAAALDEQVGGISISAVVVPDASDFAAAMDEQVGGLQVTVAVVPDASDFAAALDEQIGGLTATVTVVPDASDLESAIGEQLGQITVPIVPGAADFTDAVGEQTGAITVPVIPNAAEFAAALDEEAGGLSVSVAVVPDTTDFEAAVDEQVGDIAVPVGLRVDAATLATASASRQPHRLVRRPGQVTPDMSDFADAVLEEAAGIVVAVTVTPAMADFGDAVQEQANASRPSSRSLRTPTASPRRLSSRSRIRPGPRGSRSRSPPTPPRPSQAWRQLEEADAGGGPEASAAGEQFAALSGQFADL